jgi:hypothetical protein
MRDDERFPLEEAGMNAVATLLGSAAFLAIWWITGVILFATVDMCVAIGLGAGSMYFARDWYRYHHPHQPR